MRRFAAAPSNGMPAMGGFQIHRYPPKRMGLGCQAGATEFEHPGRGNQTVADNLATHQELWRAGCNIPAALSDHKPQDHGKQPA